jgi:hypothetical protein
MTRTVPGARNYLAPLIQWQPTLSSHDPNPPIPIEGATGTTITLILATWKWQGQVLQTNAKTMLTLVKKAWTWQGQVLEINAITEIMLALQGWVWRGQPINLDKTAKLLLLLRVGH